MTALGLHHRRNGRRGFTLIEVMLTLTILALIAAIAWPNLTEPFAALRLKKAAEQVRVRWSEARVKALDTGQIHVFQYVVDGDRYRVKCRAECQAQIDPFLGTDFGDSASTADAGVDVLLVDDEGTLAERVTFVGSETEADTRAQLFELQTGQSEDYASTLEETWSQPILFYPDGTTSTARLLLKNEYDLYIELKIRGMTGVVRIGETQTIDSRTPYTAYSN